MFLAMVVSTAIGQDIVLEYIPQYKPAYPQFSVRTDMQQHDGDIITNIFPSIPNPGGTPTYVGNVVYKVSPASLEVTDSLSFFDTINYFFFAKDPRGEGNLRIDGEADGGNGALLRISRFPDNDLNIDPEDDVVVPLCEDCGYDFTYRYMIDSRGDIIVEYYTLDQDGFFVGHLARFGLDGTLKHEAILPQNRHFMMAMGEYQHEPLKYYMWTINSNHSLIVSVLDEYFQQTNSYAIDKNYLYSGTCVWEEFLFSTNKTYVIPDGDDVLIAAAYYHDSCFFDPQDGAAVARYELRTMQQKDLVKFRENQSQYPDINCLCFEKASDGSLYFVFREVGKIMTIVKMDTDFNILWKRYTPDKPYLSIKTNSSLLYDENGHEKGIFIEGFNGDANVPTLCYFFLTDESLLNCVDTRVEIRPYMFYPNPAQDQLHLQYSPDVTPARIELHDMQGRLVRTQIKSLESVDLQGLTAGQYLMKVTMEDGKVYSDKVVKE